MGTPHKHRDVIIAWANGEIVQYRFGAKDKWKTYNEIFAPSFDARTDYRIKGKQVTKIGWMNVYLGVDTGKWYVYPTKKEADEAAGHATPNRRCIRIEWEEEA